MATKSRFSAKDRHKILKQKRRSPNHFFYFHLLNPVTNKEMVQKFPAKVKDGKKKIVLTVKEEDVCTAIKANGAGNTQCCTMAVCAQRSADLFPHTVEGFIDWQYRTAYVVSKVKNGVPIECYRYSHHDKIAHINDSPSGMKKLRKVIADAGGEIRVTLLPYQKNYWSPKQHAHGVNMDGSRSSKKTALVLGAARRFAVANFGLNTASVTKKLNAND
jgi:hypothetical protein